MKLQGLNSALQVEDLIYRIVVCLAISQTNTNWIIDEQHKSAIIDILYRATNDNYTRLESGNTILEENSLVSVVNKDSVSRLTFDLLFTRIPLDIAKVCLELVAYRYKDNDVKMQQAKDIIKTGDIKKLVQLLFLVIGLNNEQILSLTRKTSELMFKYRNTDTLQVDFYNCNFMSSTICSWFIALARSYKNLHDSKLFDIFRQLQPDITQRFVKYNWSSSGKLDVGSTAFGLLYKCLDFWMKGHFKQVYNIHNAKREAVFEAVVSLENAEVKNTVSSDVAALLSDMVRFDTVLFSHRTSDYGDTFLCSTVEYLQYRALESEKEHINSKLKQYFIQDTKLALRGVSQYLTLYSNTIPSIRSLNGGKIIYTSGNNESQSKYTERKGILDVLYDIIEDGFPQNEDSLNFIIKKITRLGTGVAGAKYSSIFSANKTAGESVSTFGKSKTTTNTKISILIDGAIAWFKFLSKLKAHGYSIFDVHKEIVHDRFASKKFSTINQIAEASYTVYDNEYYFPTRDEDFSDFSHIPNSATILDKLVPLCTVPADLESVSVPFVDVEHLFKVISTSDKSPIHNKIIADGKLLLNTFKQASSSCIAPTLKSLVPIARDHCNSVVDVFVESTPLNTNMVDNCLISPFNVAYSLQKGESIPKAFGLSEIVDNRCVKDSLMMSTFDHSLDYFYKDSFHLRRGEAYTTEVERATSRMTFVVTDGGGNVNDYYRNNIQSYSTSIYNGYVLAFTDKDLEAQTEVDSVLTKLDGQSFTGDVLNYIPTLVQQLPFHLDGEITTSYDYLKLLRRASIYATCAVFLYETTDRLEKLLNVGDLFNYDMMQFITNNKLLFKLPHLTAEEVLRELCQLYPTESFMLLQETSEDIYADMLPIVEQMLQQLNLKPNTDGAKSTSQILELWNVSYFKNLFAGNRSNVSKAFEVVEVLTILSKAIKTELAVDVNASRDSRSQEVDFMDFCINDNQYVTKQDKGVLYYLHSSGIYAGLQYKSDGKLANAECKLKPKDSF